MKKKLLKFTIIFFILIKGDYFVYANENIILPEKKPDINKAQTSNKIANYLIPIKKPTLNAEKTKQKIVKKLKEELVRDMTLMGCDSINKLSKKNIKFI